MTAHSSSPGTSITLRHAPVTPFDFSGMDLASFFELSAELLSVIDVNGNFVAVNSEWETHFGFSRQEILGQHLESLAHPDDLEAVASHGQPIGLRSASLKFRCRCKTGQYRWLLWNQTPL